MKIHLSSDEMLAQWKLRRGFAPLRADCVISRTDGIDLDNLLNLLATAPLEMLATTNIASDIAVVPTGEGGAVVMLPESCRRIVEFQLDGWQRPAIIVDDPLCHLARIQANPFSRGLTVNPVVVKQQNRLFVYSLPAGSTPKITRAIAVMEPTDGSYEMDESALSTIN